jgi:hypothetical protein
MVKVSVGKKYFFYGNSLRFSESGNLARLPRRVYEESLPLFVPEKIRVRPERTNRKTSMLHCLFLLDAFLPRIQSGEDSY